MKHLQLLLSFLCLLPSALTAQAAANLRETYVLRANDTVRLSVYEEPELATEVTILKTGQASFPLIGTLEIEGLSLTEASDQIRARYAADYIRTPMVTLTVVEYATEYVSVIGQVSQPGKVPIPQVGQLDLGSALASAGGITDSADPKNLQWISAAGESRVFALTEIQGESGGIVMTAGDKLVVHESVFARSEFSVLGEVSKPGSYPIPKSGKMDLSSALAMAGGLNEFADASAIKLVKATGQTSEHSFKLIQTGPAGELAVIGGDRVIVNKSPFVNTTVTVLGEVKSPGRIALPIDGKLNLMSAIAMAGGFTDLANLKKVTLSRNGISKEYDVRKIGKNGNDSIPLLPNDTITVDESWF